MAQEWHEYKFYASKAGAEKNAAILHKKGKQARVKQVQYKKEGKSKIGYYTEVKYDFWAGERPHR